MTPEMESLLRAHDARMQAMSEQATADTQDRCRDMLREIAAGAVGSPALRRAVALRDQVQTAIDGALPPGADIASGITPTGLAWLPVREAVFHDLDTAKGIARQRIAWTGYQDIDGQTSGFRFLGFDACEISRQRQTVGEITDAEIAQGIKARDWASEMLAAGAVLQVAEDETLRQDTTYDRRLAWARFVLPDKSLVHLAEYAKAHAFDRTVWLAQQGTP